MNILVTGCAGFIGSHVSEALLKRGDAVVGVDNFNEYYDPKIKEANVQLFRGKKFTLCRRDINDDRIEDLFKKNAIDIIIHLAARAGVRASLENPRLYTTVNVEGTLHLLDLAMRYNVKKFVYGSSSSVYGARTTVPFRESDAVDQPISPYAATKRSSELMCFLYHQLSGMDIACLRFFTVYGPRGRPDMAVASFTKAIAENKVIIVYGDGTSKRDYTYVNDIVEGVTAAVDRAKGFQIFNLGESRTVELRYLISLIEKEVGKKAQISFLPPAPGDVPITYADITKAKEMLGYNPSVPIEEGIKRYVAWLRSAL